MTKWTPAISAERRSDGVERPPDGVERPPDGMERPKFAFERPKYGVERRFDDEMDAQCRPREAERRRGASQVRRRASIRRPNGRPASTLGGGATTWRRPRTASSVDSMTKWRLHVEAGRQNVDGRTLHVEAGSQSVDGRRLHVEAGSPSVDGKTLLRGGERRRRGPAPLPAGAEPWHGERRAPKDAGQTLHADPHPPKRELATLESEQPVLSLSCRRVKPHPREARGCLSGRRPFGDAPAPILHNFPASYER